MENLYLKWEDVNTGRKYILGALCRDKEKGKYYFKLSSDFISKAEETDFCLAMLPFSNVNKIYESDILFPFFSSRIPHIEEWEDESIQELLDEYKMKEYDEFELLKKTRGILMTDHYIIEEDR